MQCETADVAEEVAVQEQNIDVQCNQSGTNIARKGRAAIARREAPERVDTYASARRAAMLHIIAFASRNSRKEIRMQCCKKRSEGTNTRLYISTSARRTVSKRRDNAILQGPKRCYKDAAAYATGAIPHLQ